LEAARRRLLEATTARKAVSLLRERRLAEWRLGERRREEREIDDLNTMRRGGRYGRAEEAV
jgi:flagellar export protein FliJ